MLDRKDSYFFAVESCFQANFLKKLMWKKGGTKKKLKEMPTENITKNKV